MGLTITDISKTLDISRNTVYKYLARLEADEKIYKKSVGRYKLYYSQEKKILNKEGIISFIKGLLANLKRTFPNQEALFKEYGKKMAKDMEIPFSKEGQQFLTKFKESTDLELLEAIGEIFPHFNILQDSIKISEIDVIKREKKAIITFVNSEMMEKRGQKSDEYIYYFYLLGGLMEKKLSEYLEKEVRFDLLEYEAEKNVLNVSFNLQILLPDMQIEGIKKLKIPNSEDLDVNIIKKYLDPLSLSYILFGVVSRKKILLLLERVFLKHHLEAFFKLIFKDNFEYEIIVEEIEEYIKDKKLFKDALILGESKVIEGVENKVKERDIKIERNIVEKFYTSYPEKASLITLKNEIKKAYILAEELSNRVVEVRENGDKGLLDIKQLFEKLEKKYNIDLVLPYIVFLTDIVEKYFGVKVSDIWKFFTYRLA
jgi:DNA-binding transcriptional ArsR family regulator